jgi:hypothetical protein
MPEPDGEPRAQHDADDESPDRNIDRWIEPVFTDPALGPVLLVAFASLSTFGAALLLLAWRSRNLFAIAALTVSFWVTADIARRDLVARRLGYASRALLGLWGLSLLGAGAAVWLGLY